MKQSHRRPPLERQTATKYGCALSSPSIPPRSVAISLADLLLLTHADLREFVAGMLLRIRIQIAQSLSVLHPALGTLGAGVADAVVAEAAELHSAIVRTPGTHSRDLKNPNI